MTTDRRPAQLARTATAVLAGALLATWLAASCRSLSKSDLEERLKQLPKNAPVEPLQRRALRADLGSGPEDLELVYARAAGPATAAGDERTPVVLVHGTPSTLFTWAEVMYGASTFEGLAAERDVYALEILGHGVAPGESSPCTFERCARFVVAAIDALGLERVHLVGSSYGGEFAWRAALAAPERVASLVLIDSSGYARGDGEWLPEEVQMRENSLAKIGWVLNSRSRIASALAPHFDVIPPDRVEEFFLVCANASNWKAMVDLARDENGERQGDLTRLSVPTLVLWGAQDVAYSLSAYGERFARDIPGARMHVLPATGHYPHEQRPREVVSALASFFRALEQDS